MRSLQYTIILTMIFLLTAEGIAFSNDGPSGQLKVSFSDQAKPGELRVSQGSGDITVIGYSGKEIIIESDSVVQTPRENHDNERARGLRKISGSQVLVNSWEDENIIDISSSIDNDSNMTIHVPTQTSLKLGGMIMEGDITVTGVTGDFEINTLDGDIVLTGISGTVVAHSVDGDITVSLDSVDPQKPMSFSTVDGDIDVTLPGDIEANVHMKNIDGDIFTDFEIELVNYPVEVKNRKSKSTGNAKQRSWNNPSSPHTVIQDMITGNILTDIIMSAVGNNLYGSINGGGPEIQFITIDGDIFLRKK